MSKFVVIVFDSEAKAYEGTRALKELHAEGNVTLFSEAVVTKDAAGKLSVKDMVDQGPLGTAVGGLVGGLVGLLGGPAGAVVGIASGMVIGSIGDLLDIGVGTDFVDKVSHTLAPGKTAVIAEVEEDWVTPLNTRIETIGGTIVREVRSDFEDEQIAKEAAARKAELQQLKAEWAQSSAEAKTKLQAQINEVKAKLGTLSSEVETRLKKLEADTSAKVASVNDQIAKAKADNKARIEKRLAEVRADHDRRAAKLKQAGELVKEALAP
jgi:uncharacterized membrane protein/copper chaperone CopZ